jgi:Glycosyl transferases group 1
MAVGRPAVAFHVGANRSIVVHGETGFLAQSAEDWVTAIDGLARDPQRVRTIGLASRRQAEVRCNLHPPRSSRSSGARSAIGKDTVLIVGPG